MLDGQHRIALIFTTVVTLFVFAHNQPWPYVFIMAQPFLALWALKPLERISESRATRLACIALVLAIGMSFVRNVQFLAIDNRAQMEVVARAEALLGPQDVYFDGIGMLPNRPEPSTLWLDRKAVLTTLAERERSEAYRIFQRTPSKVLLWSYRLDDIRPVVAPLLETRYVRVAPNIRLIGRDLAEGSASVFDVPVAGRYALYDREGNILPGQIEVDGRLRPAPLDLAAGRRTINLRSGPGEALLLPEAPYAGRLRPGADHPDLFDKVYD
jgi:hypothetical protein